MFGYGLYLRGLYDRKKGELRDGVIIPLKIRAHVQAYAEYFEWLGTQEQADRILNYMESTKKGKKIPRLLKMGINLWNECGKGILEREKRNEDIRDMLKSDKDEAN